MAGLVPIGESPASGDITTGANIDKSLSYSQRAVDRRVGVVVEPAVADALSKDPTIVQAAVNAVNNRLDTIGLSTANLGIDTDGTPFYDPGNRTYKMGVDFDGTPYYTI